MTVRLSQLFRRSLTNAVTVAAALLLIAASPSSGDNFFLRGEFDRAKAAYADDLAHHPSDPDAILGLARIELYENHLDAAAAYGAKLLSLRPDDSIARRLLQTVKERRAVLKSAQSLEVPVAGIALPFLESEPLPAIRLLINGKPGTFILDTGGVDVTLDPDFARDCGLTIERGREGTFLGGKTAEVGEALAGRVEAGSIVLRNASVTILPSHGMHLFVDRAVDGVVGTVFLSRFDATIDYPHHRLVLRPRGVKPALHVSDTTVPMWLVGDHFIFSAGSVNGFAGQLFSIDSGGAGVGFMPVAATVTAAHVKTFEGNAFAAMGGGGSVRAIPTVADQVCLGDACQNEVNGAYTPGGSPLSMFPFKAAGTVSHEFLKKYAVTFDFVRMRIILTRPEKQTNESRGRCRGYPAMSASAAVRSGKRKV